ncbi:MAG: hypothetical protein K2W97_04015 [Chthoniobacterales bacterium]|nr:hypothetical protein [Chthoniobacterales bacterium]
MGSIPSVSSSIGSQSPIPPSVNQNAASNPVSNVNSQQGLSQANNAGSTASNATAKGESMVQGIIGNLLSPMNKA